jgi:plastocyanin domain-containing protein
MNTIILTTALLTATIFHGEKATVKADVKHKIEQSLNFNEVNLPLQQNQRGLVRVGLQLDENGQLQIVEANYSHLELKNILADRLAEIDLDGITSDEVFYFEFHFEKH